MNEKYAPLFEPITLPNGVILADRFTMSPIITNSSTAEGFVTEEDLKYAERRASSARLQVTGAAYIEEYGQLFEYGFGSSDDRHIAGLKRLAKAMKKSGSIAIIQLTHAGRFSKQSLEDFGVVYGPSEISLNTPVPHKVLAMSKRKMNHVITQYADATRRAIAAGFDGVEISAAQRLLIQTFFSMFSNERTDEYGPQTIENRSRFGLEVIQAVQDVIDAEAPKGFILGFRWTPEETRGNEIGYSIEDSCYFIDSLLEVANIGYIATASWGKNIYKQTLRTGVHKGEFMNKVFHDHINNRVPMMATGGINTPDKAMEALQFSDMVGASTPFVTEPEFVEKIRDGREDEIDLGIAEGELENLAIPRAAFKDIVYMMDLGQSLPDDTRDEMRKLQDNYEK